jgi:transcriptional regulator with XRE-family HTH domain
MISIEVKEKLSSLGLRLRECRLVRNEPQERFAARLGISIPTLRKMENGDPSVSIGLWAETLWLLERMKDMDEILKNEVSLFDQMDARSKPKRQRASKRTC